MASRTVGRRSALFALVAALALAEPTLRVNARAADGLPTAAPVAGEASSQADLTWGTGPDETGRASRVMGIAVAGRQVFLAGDFTAMVPPGSTWSAPTRKTTTTTATAPASTPTSPPTTNTTETPTVGALVAEAPSVTPALPPGSVRRRHLAALDVDKHTLLPWNPDADGTVYAILLSSDGRHLYVGGEFDHIGGVPAAKLARIDVATGEVDPAFAAQVKGRVKALALAGDRLYVGGSFTSVGGPNGVEARSKVAALDAASGELLPWTPPPMGSGSFVGHNGTPTPDQPSGDVLAIAAPGDASRVFVAGTFLDFAGHSALVVLDSTTGQAVPEQYAIRRPIFDLAVWPADGETVFASGGGSGGQVYAFRVDQPGRPVWSAWVDGDSPGVAASDDDVYLMGHYDYAGPQRELRRHLAAFDATDGAVGDWNPTANTPQGAFSAAVGADHVFVGGEFTRINGNPQPGFAQFNLAPQLPPTTTSGSSTTTTSRATMKG